MEGKGKISNSFLLELTSRNPPFFVCIVRPSCEGGFTILSSMNIHVQDCDECWNPYWEDELVNGLCADCQ